MLREKDARLLVGQLVVRRLPADPQTLDLERLPVGNYIVFKDALAQSLEDSKALLDEAKRRIREHGIEPLFMMDEEGGRVTQISAFFPSAPSPAAISRTLEPDQARVLYGHLSETLASLGIDLNLAPCADVNTEPLNPVIGTRAFSSNPKTVGDYCTAFIESSKAYTGCVAKHFPGHGMTAVDSHLDMPSAGVSRDELETTHVPPFEQAVRAGAAGIMISHCHYPALQAEASPASLSRPVVQDLLRKDLGFDGLVMTDSLDMDAVTGNIDPVDASTAALDAGVDMLLFTEDSVRLEATFESVTADLVSGTLDRRRLAGSIARRRFLLDRLSARRRPDGTATGERYFQLRARVMKAAVRKDDPRGVLPLTAGDLAYVTTDTAFFERTTPRPTAMTRVTRDEDAAGRALILWLMEPFRLRYSVDRLRRMIEASRLSVLVTSYRCLADSLKASDAKIVTDDISPETQAAIARDLFGGM
jgi:beta-N-acetylhexosaminidase